MKNVGGRSISAVFWGGGGAVARIVLQFCAQVLLARLLGPEQYGLFAIGAVVVSFSNFFADIGIAYGLIQKETLTDADLRFVTTWQFLIGSLVSVALFLGSPAIAHFFNEPRAVSVVQALSAICLVNAMAAPSLNLLKRTLDFKRIQIAQLAAYIVGYIGIGIPLALAGWQVWALVVAWLVQSAIVLVILYGFVRHAVRPLIWFADAAGLAKYGVTVLITNLVNWVINNVDRLVVGKVFASKDIGLYTTSYNMLYNPTSSLLGVIQPVFFSASARLGNSQDRIASGYLALIGAVTLFLLPAFVGLAAVADTFALAVYGDAWRGLGQTLQPLALAMPLFLLWGLTTPLLWTGGSPSREFKSQLPLAAIWVVAAWSAAQVSLVAVAWAAFGLFACRYAVILFNAMQLLQLTRNAIWTAIRGGLLLSVFCGTLVFAIDFLLKQSLWHPMATLLFDIFFGIFTFAGALWFAPGLVAVNLKPLLAKVSARAPKPIAYCLQRLQNN